MPDRTTVTGKLVIVERMKNSTYGNPRYKVLIGEHAYATPPDAGWVYGIANHRDATVTATVGMRRGVATVFSVEPVRA